MSLLLPTFRHLIVAIVVLVSSGRSLGHSLEGIGPAHLLLAEAGSLSSEQRSEVSSVERPTNAVESNAVAYVELIVIPFMLFIGIVGVVRRQDV